MDNTNTCPACDGDGYQPLCFGRKRFLRICRVCDGSGHVDAPAADVPTCDGCGGAHSVQDVCPADVGLLD